MKQIDAYDSLLSKSGEPVQAIAKPGLMTEVLPCIWWYRMGILDYEIEAGDGREASRRFESLYGRLHGNPDPALSDYHLLKDFQNFVEGKKLGL